MKNVIFIAMIFSAMTLSNMARGQEMVSMGEGYIYDVYYSMEGGVVDFMEREDWDLGFYTDPMSGGIITNCGTSLYDHVKLYTYPKADTSAWLNLDTNGLSTWPVLYNGEDRWENGAFNRNSQGYPDYGWGIKNPATSDITGDSLYIIQLADGTFKQVWIVKKQADENKYIIRYADLDNSSQKEKTLDIDNYLGMNFVYFDFESGQLSDREPDTEDWDLLFTRYQALQPIGQYYLVSGVFNNVTSPGNKFHPVTLDFNDWSSKPMDTAKTVIGWDWKWFDFASGWNLEDSLVFFVNSPNGNIYKLYFMVFAGTSSGDIIFNQEIVSMVGTDDLQENETSIQLLPNPATNTVRISWNNDLDKEAVIRIYDISGKEVISRKLNANALKQAEISLDISSLNDGMYIVSIITGETLINEKLLVK